MIYAVVHTKGGVGKTTTAVHLAAMFAIQAPTLLIDGDPQASAASWAAWRRDGEFLTSPVTTVLKGKAILDEGKKLAAGFKTTVVDAGGRDTAGLRSTLLLAQQAIVPMGASSFDAAAMTDLLEVIELARAFNPPLTVRVLLTRVNPRTKDTGEMRAYVQEQNLALFDTAVAERVAYRRAIRFGATVHEPACGQLDPRAIMEMETFFQEVWSLEN
jgi:chromosome partitioning protein